MALFDKGHGRQGVSPFIGVAENDDFRVHWLYFNLTTAAHFFGMAQPRQ